MKRIVIVIPHSHTWFWTQTCLAALRRYPPCVAGVEARIIVVDNSWDWSPAIRGVTQTALGDGIEIFNNPCPSKFHASALDHVVKICDFDYFMALETDVIVLRHDWLNCFLDHMQPGCYAVGHWHHEQFVNPSCTLYNGEALRGMLAWCRANPSREMRWGEHFEKAEPLEPNMVLSTCGPFAEKRGWPEGTVLKEPPTGQVKGPGWYEPGQALHHWALQEGWNYALFETATTERVPGLPTQTFYGMEPPAPEEDLEPDVMWGQAVAVHLWGGTRALDILKHPVECQFVRKNAAFWQEREARFWRAIVPADVQKETLDLIRTYGFHFKGQGTPDVTPRDRAAACEVMENYRRGGAAI